MSKFGTQKNLAKRQNILNIQIYFLSDRRTIDIYIFSLYILRYNNWDRKLMMAVHLYHQSYWPQPGEATIYIYSSSALLEIQDCIASVHCQNNRHVAPKHCQNYCLTTSVYIFCFLEPQAYNTGGSNEVHRRWCRVRTLSFHLADPVPEHFCASTIT